MFWVFEKLQAEALDEQDVNWGIFDFVQEKEIMAEIQRREDEKREEKRRKEIAKQVTCLFWSPKKSTVYC